ncbi:MAG: amidase [Selenomonadaceae bacterium]|nr:amidase [Selenomonadaceae bacterium]
MQRKMMQVLWAFVFLLFVTSGAAQAHSFTQEELAYMPAVEQLKHFKAGTITPLEVLEAQIARIEKYNGPIKKNSSDLLDDYRTWNGKVNAIQFERFAEAREAAVKAGERWKNGTARALEGITVGVKNDDEVAGWRVDQGSILLKDAPICEHDTAVVEKLRDAGAIFVFSTTVPEFYVTYTTWSKLYGITRNPWNGDTTVGGSSGGSGAALAAGFCTLATGSDMGGSIRLPAAFNGVYGFKPPFGRVPTSDIQYETFGPMARNFDDLVIMQNIINGPSTQVMSSIRPRMEYPTKYKDLKGAKIAVSYFSQWSGMGNDKEVDAAMDATVEALRKAGAQVDVIEFDWNGAEFMDIFFKGLMSTQMYMLIEQTEGQDLSQLTPYAAAIIGMKDQLGPSKLVEAGILMNKCHAEIQERIFEQGYEALILPTCLAGEVPADMDIDDTTKPVFNGKRLTGNSMKAVTTSIFNLLCTYPVVDVPVAISSNNVPIGLQVVGNTYDDIAAFRVAAQLSKVMPKLYTGSRMPDFRNMK